MVRGRGLEGLKGVEGMEGVEGVGCREVEGRVA